jgi:hypothetical protein
MVVAQSLGVACQAWIFPNLPAEPFLEKTWLGQCTFGKFTKPQQRMISVAGAVAEACWRDRDIWDVAAEIDWYEPEVMSETDWHFSGCPVGEPSTRLFAAIDKVALLLRPDSGPLWPSLLRTAHELIVESREIFLPSGVTTASMVDELAKLIHQTPPSVGAEMAVREILTIK